MLAVIRVASHYGHFGSCRLWFCWSELCYMSDVSNKMPCFGSPWSKTQHLVRGQEAVMLGVSFWHSDDGSLVLKDRRHGMNQDARHL